MTVDCAKLNTGCDCRFMQSWTLAVTVDYAKLNTGCDCRLKLNTGCDYKVKHWMWL